MRKFNPYLFSLIIINSIIYYKWLNFSVFTFSDWTFFFKEALMGQFIPTIWNTTYTFGSVDIILWKLPVYLMTGIFGIYGFDYNVAEKFIVFWPIIFVLPLGSFFLIRHIIKSDLGAFIGSLVYSFNTYFLSIDTQGHQFLTVAFSFATLAILFFIKLLDERKFYLALLIGISLFIVGFYDLRSLYITVGILGLYFLYYTLIHFDEIKKDFLKIWGLGITPFLLYFLLSLYWLLPILRSGTLANNEILGRQIFGSEFYNIQSSLTTFFPFWTGGETEWFTVQQIHWYFWIYPLLAILGLILNKNNAKVVFFALIAILGIFLSKQADIPFTHIYSWLYENFPGFSAFREASKFDFMVSLGYAVLIGGFVSWLWKKDLKGKLYHAKYIIVFIIAFVALWNGKPMTTGEIKSLFVPRTVPQEFVSLKEIIFQQPQYSRTLWINMTSDWPVFNNVHPSIDGKDMLIEDWSQYFQREYSDKDLPEGEKIIAALQDPMMNNLLDLSSIKYVIIPLYDKETDNDIVNGFGKSHQYYREHMERIPYLTKVENMPENILVYENSNFRPHIYTTQVQEQVASISAEGMASREFEEVEYTQVSPSEYKIQISNTQDPIFLNFTDNFHSSWKARVGEFSWIDVLLSDNYFIDDSFHTKSDIGFNAFAIDPEKICQEFGCQRNDGGSYDIEMTLYFKPQSYLYLGMIISGTTLILCLSYLIYYGIKKTKNKK